MPLISSNGYSRCLLRRRTRRAGRTSTRSICRPTATLRTLTVENIGARGGAEHGEGLPAQLARGVLLPATAFAQPGGVVRPPAAGDGHGLLEPLARVGRGGGRGLECRLR